MNPSQQDQSYNEDLEIRNRKDLYFENQHKRYNFRNRKKIHKDIYQIISNESYSSFDPEDSNMYNQESESFSSEKKQYSDENRSENKQNSEKQGINEHKHSNNSPQELIQNQKKSSVEIKDYEEKVIQGEDEIIIVEDADLNK